MVALPIYHICLICTAIGSLVRGGLPHQRADEAYVILLPESTYVSQNGLFALLMVCPFRGLVLLLDKLGCHCVPLCATSLMMPPSTTQISLLLFQLTDGIFFACCFLST